MSRPWRCRTVLPLLLLLGACRPPAAEVGWKGWDRTPVQYARYFQLLKKDGATVLLTFGPGGDRDTTGRIGLASQGGAVFPPGTVQLPEGPLRLALLSTTHASYLSALGMAGQVVGCAHLGRLRDPAVDSLARKGKVTEIGSAEGVDREKILALRPDVLFSYPYGQQGAALPRTLAVVPVTEYLEPHPLGRAEWLLAFGAMTGQDSLAAALFEAIEDRYRKTAQAVPASAVKPAVFFGSAWRGVWSVPAGNSYMAQLIADAGGRYLFADQPSTGNFDISLEKVLAVGAGARFWGRVLDQPGPITAADVAGGDARLLALPAFRGKGCFYASSAESDLFGKAALEPDVVLQDLVSIFHPAPAHGHTPVYFRPVQ